MTLRSPGVARLPRSLMPMPRAVCAPVTVSLQHPFVAMFSALIGPRSYGGQTQNLRRFVLLLILLQIR